MIRAVLFDVGGTFTTVRNSPELQTAFAKRLSERLALYGIRLDVPYEKLGLVLHENAEAYKHHVEETKEELPNARVWSEFYLKDYSVPEETIAPYAEELSFLYDYERLISLRRPHLKETLETLHAEGFRLGVVSNVFSRSLTPHLLMEYGIDHLMETVILSSNVGCRKPDPRIFRIAMDELGVTADETCYVGDTLSRDVLGSRNANLALSVQITNPAVAHRDVAFTGPDGPKPDYLIDDLAELPPILRRVNASENPLPSQSITDRRSQPNERGTEMLDTIFFDVGNTLRVVVKDKEFSDAAEAEIMRLVETTESHDEFFAKLTERWNTYRKGVKKSLLDASEMELWSQHLLPDYDTELICRNAARLTRLWRDHDGRRVARPDVKSTLIELDKRGYTMGIIANTITETEIPDWMFEDQVARFFKTVVLSSKVRLRKPDPAIYLLACRAIGKKPENCAYVGDNPIRDVQGTRDAGFAKMIRIDEPDTIRNEPQEIILHPDHTITKISDLLDIFPPLK